jgi:hypothetical protein
MALDRHLEELIASTRAALQSRASLTNLLPSGGCSNLEAPPPIPSRNVVPTVLPRADAQEHAPSTDTRIHDKTSDPHEGRVVCKESASSQSLESEKIAAEVAQPLKVNPSEVRLPPEIAELLEVQRLKYHPALNERRREAIRHGDPAARARALEALDDLEGFTALSSEIRAEAEAIAETWLPELECFILGRAKTKIVRAVATMMLEARLWSYGGAEHFFCTLPDIAALSGLSLRSVQRHLSPSDPRVHLLARWLSRRSLYGARSSGETSRIGTVFRFRLEAVPLESLEPLPQPRLEALCAPWRSSGELPGAISADEELEVLANARYRPDGTPVLSVNRQKTAGNTTFPIKTGNAILGGGIRIEGVHLEAFIQHPLNSYTRQSRDHRQGARNAARADAGREPLAKLEVLRLNAELIGERCGRGSSQYASALEAVERAQDEWALAVRPLPRLGAFKRLDQALEAKARAVASRLGDSTSNVPFWKSAFKQAGNDSLIYKAVSDTLEAAKDNKIRESLARYAVGMLKKARVIRGAAQSQLLQESLEQLEIRL